MPRRPHPVFPFVPGIVGGLGPFAHIGFEQRLLEIAQEKHGADTDSGFPPWLVSSMPHTPDRTEALADRVDSPAPFLLESLNRLAAGGADFAVIICNTMHAFLPEVAGRMPLPVLHVAIEAADFVKRRFPDLSCIGLLATTGTCRSSLFDPYFEAKGIKMARPSDTDQEDLVMTAIYGEGKDGARRGGIKGGALEGGDRRPAQMLAKAAEALVRDHHAGAILSACSEIPLALGPTDLNVPLVDTMSVLAAATLDVASGARALSAIPGPDAWRGAVSF